MNMRIIIISLLVLLTASGVLAGKKLTIRNAETGESFEVELPDGLKIYECNEEWLDSVPYLVEHARWKEPWAFDALAECYRYGKGGLEKCMFSALGCYDCARRDGIRLAEEAFAADSSDEFGFLAHTVGALVRGRSSEAEVLARLDSNHDMKPAWAVLLGKILRCDSAGREKLILSQLTPQSSGDEYMVAFSYLSIYNAKALDRLLSSTPDAFDRLRMYGDKVPMMYDAFASHMWRDEPVDADDKASLATSLEFMHIADKHGFLSKDNMEKVLAYYAKHGKDVNLRFSDDDLRRFATLCPQSTGEDRNKN